MVPFACVREMGDARHKKCGLSKSALVWPLIKNWASLAGPGCKSKKNGQLRSRPVRPWKRTWPLSVFQSNSETTLEWWLNEQQSVEQKCPGCHSELWCCLSSWHQSFFERLQPYHLWLQSSERTAVMKIGICIDGKMMFKLQCCTNVLLLANCCWHMQ